MDHKNIDPEVILGDYDPEVLTGEGQLGMSDATDDAPTDWSPELDRQQPWLDVRPVRDGLRLLHFVHRVLAVRLHPVRPRR